MKHFVDEFGEHWRDDDNQYHREDGPAFISIRGGEQWYIHGLRHRIGGPASTNQFGDTFWYENGVAHRIDGPAYEYHDGREERWIVNGWLHRLYAPAFIGLDYEKWYINGKQTSGVINDWIEDHDINPNWREWTDSEKTLFRLRFL